MKSLQGYSKTKSGPGAQFRTYSGPFLALWSGSGPSPEFRTFVVPLYLYNRRAITAVWGKIVFTLSNFRQFTGCQFIDIYLQYWGTWYLLTGPEGYPTGVSILSENWIFHKSWYESLEFFRCASISRIYCGRSVSESVSKPQFRQGHNAAP